MLSAKGWKVVNNTKAVINDSRQKTLSANFLEAHFSKMDWLGIRSIDAYLTVSPKSSSWDCLKTTDRPSVLMGATKKDFQLWKELGRFRALQMAAENGFPTMNHLLIHAETSEAIEKEGVFAFIEGLIAGGEGPLPGDVRIYGNVYSERSEENIAVVMSRVARQRESMAQKFVAPRMYLGAYASNCEELYQALRESDERNGAALVVRKYGPVDVLMMGKERIDRISSNERFGDSAFWGVRDG